MTKTKTETPVAVAAPAAVASPVDVALAAIPSAPIPVMEPGEHLIPAFFREEWKNDKRKVKGIFNDLEVKGGKLCFAFKKWPDEQIENYELADGQEYTLKISVIKHLNNLHYKQDSYSNDLVSSDGRPLKNPNPNKLKRFSFQSSDTL